MTTLPVMLWCCVKMDMGSHSQYKQDTLSVPVGLGAVLAAGYDSVQGAAKKIWLRAPKFLWAFVERRIIPG